MDPTICHTSNHEIASRLSRVKALASGVERVSLPKVAQSLEATGGSGLSCPKNWNLTQVEFDDHPIIRAEAIPSIGKWWAGVEFLDRSHRTTLLPQYLATDPPLFACAKYYLQLSYLAAQVVSKITKTERSFHRTESQDRIHAYLKQHLPGEFNSDNDFSISSSIQRGALNGCMITMGMASALPGCWEKRHQKPIRDFELKSLLTEKTMAPLAHAWSQLSGLSLTIFENVYAGNGVEIGNPSDWGEKDFFELLPFSERRKGELRAYEVMVPSMKSILEIERTLASCDGFSWGTDLSLLATGCPADYAFTPQDTFMAAVESGAPKRAQSVFRKSNRFILKLLRDYWSPSFPS